MNCLCFVMFYCLNWPEKPIIDCLMAGFIVTTYPIVVVCVQWTVLFFLYLFFHNNSENIRHTHTFIQKLTFRNNPTQKNIHRSKKCDKPQSP